jgi:protein-S-isoprenylcysteine O-methyltransferase Ste14
VERRSSLIQSGQMVWDRALMRAIPMLWLIWLPMMALDAAHFRLSQVPSLMQGIGAVTLMLSFAIVLCAYRVNSFAAPVVRLQQERHHRVITAGPYRFVRHPIYASGGLSYLGTPLLLGSWFGLAIVPIMATLLGIRAVLEERVLTAELEGYSAYVARVRYRLVPLVW